MKKHYTTQNCRVILYSIFLLFISLHELRSQSFSQTPLNFNGKGSISNGTSLMYGPDGRLYVSEYTGLIKIFTVQRNGPGDYLVLETEVLNGIQQIQDHNDDGTLHSSTYRETIGLTVAGTKTNPVIYVSSSDFRIGAGGGGDLGLDTNSGIITRFTWTGSSWDVVDLVRGLPRSEENHATNGLEFVTVNGIDYLIVAQGGHTNAGGPSKNFAYTTEYALSAAVLSINLTQLNSMPILNDNGRKYIYDIPTLDDPTRPNKNSIIDPDDPGYDGIDINDPFGGNDGLNQAMIVPGGPVQIFSPGYRNAFDLVVTESGAVYVTDNGANGGWGGFPENEGMSGTATNNYVIGEPGSSSPSGGEQINNKDHLSLVTLDIQSYTFGSFYGGHPTPVRSNPNGAGLYYNPAVTGTEGAFFRTQLYDPDGSRPGSTTDPKLGLPANWPPVPTANIVEGDWRGPELDNPDGPNDELVTVWGTNTNGIDEYTASNFEGAMKGNLIAGVNTGELRRVELNPDGTLKQLTPSFASGLGGDALGITCNGDNEIFPGTIWIVTLNGKLVVMEPQDFIVCSQPGDPNYDPSADSDFDGYTNQDEIDNGTDPCNGASQPGDFDKVAGGQLVSDLNDPDDDNDGVPDAEDIFQLGDPLTEGSDAFQLPVINQLFSSNQDLKGYLGLGLTGLMNNGDPNPNWLNWLDRRDDPNDPNPNDILGGAIGAMTMQMTSGTALGTANNQEKAFQYGVQVNETTGKFLISGGIMNFNAPLQLYGNTSAPNAELGIFMGDGTQSNYVKFVLTPNGFLIQQEINDVPQNPYTFNITTGNRPLSGVVLYIQVNPLDGMLSFYYSFDNGTRQHLTDFPAQGTILNAIKLAEADLAVGLIGTSNAPGVEIEGTWDLLNVTGSGPYIVEDIPDIKKPVNAGQDQISLIPFFGNNSEEDLQFSVSGNSNETIQASVTGSTLTLEYPGFPSQSLITIRATDVEGKYVEQVFQIVVTDEPFVLYRVNAGGPTINSIDGEMNWEADTATEMSPYLSEPAKNRTYSGVITSYTNEVDLTTTPVNIFSTERYDTSTGPPNFTYSFPVSQHGEYEIRLYMGNGYGGTAAAGQRLFDVSIEGIIHSNLDDIDLSGQFGHKVGAVISRVVEITDGFIDISFMHVLENPLVNGIEILTAPGGANKIFISSIPEQSNVVGDQLNGSLKVTATGGDGDLVYSLTGAPAGVYINETTGEIGGIIEDDSHLLSPYTVTVTVDDGDDDTEDLASREFLWRIFKDPITPWINMDENESYTARHECSFVQAGNKFFLVGGREKSRTVDIYNYSSNSWTSLVDSAPLSFNHYQAVEYNGLIWIIGAFKDNAFPSELPAENIWIFNPVTYEWIQGPLIPEARRRGSAGLVVYNDKFYITGGNTIGHNGGFVPWFDEYDPKTGIWTALPDAPRARDHFHSVVIGNNLYAAGGRLSGGTGGTYKPLIAQVDVYDFNSKTWSTLPSSANLPTPRAAASTVNFKDKLLVIGGEVNNEIVYGETVDDALKITEEYDPVKGTWTRLADLNFERHGTQAIVSGNGVFILAGSPVRGGGAQKNMEYLGTNSPVGAQGIASQLVVPSEVILSSRENAQLEVVLTNGNLGEIITSMEIIGPDMGDFEIVSGNLSYSLLKPNTKHIVELAFTGNVSGKVATLVINYGASGKAHISIESLEGSEIRIAQIIDQTNVIGDELNGSFIVSATGGDGDLVYSMTGAPTGIVINSNTGVVSGVIDLNASLNSPYHVTIEVDDSDNDVTDTASSSFIWNVTAGEPVVKVELPDIERTIGAASETVNLNEYFDDNRGVENLTYALIENTNPSIGATITGNLLQINFSNMPAVSTLTIQATDMDHNTVQQSFEIRVLDIEVSKVIYRVNAGGPLIASIDDDIDWGADTALEKSPYLSEPAKNQTYTAVMKSYTSEVDKNTTPLGIFSTERYDSSSGVPNVTYSFPAPKAGSYEVRIYLGNGYGGTSLPGTRLFDIAIEGIVFPSLDDIDLAALFGHQVGGVITQTVEVTDGTLNISLLHGAAQNPLINAIEILGGGSESTPIEIAEILDQRNYIGEDLDGSLLVLATGGDGNLQYSISGQPAGVFIEPTNGQIGGSIALDAHLNSPYTVTVSVDDGDNDLNDKAVVNFDWYIVDPKPTVTQAFLNLERAIGDANDEFDLTSYFGDDKGVENLSYAVLEDPVSSLDAVITGNFLTLSYNQITVAQITVRATDEDQNFVEQSFTVNVTTDCTEADRNTWFRDNDGDGLGDPAVSEESCEEITGYVLNSDDCDDSNASIGVAYVWYQDLDGDKFGNVDVKLSSCSQPSGYVKTAGDCDDEDHTVYPGAPELCDGKDNNCNEIIDEDLQLSIWYADVDGDGFGDELNLLESCSQPQGYVSDGTDCDDNDASVYPGAPEICDGKDNNCSGAIDENLDPTIWYADKDSDGYGDLSDSKESCNQPNGYLADNTDCNDLNNTIYPGATEVPNDGIDQDCDGEDLVEVAYQGCTAEIWISSSAWCSSYKPTDSFFTVFGITNKRGLGGKTGVLSLRDALSQKGGGYNKLAKQATAALLNACSPAVNFVYDEMRIKAEIRDAFNNSAYNNSYANSLNSVYEAANNAGCPSGNLQDNNLKTSLDTKTSKQDEVIVEIQTEEEISLNLFPNPASSDVFLLISNPDVLVQNIAIYDYNGRFIKNLVVGYEATFVEKGKYNFNIEGLPNGVYILKVLTDINKSYALRLIVEH